MINLWVYTPDLSKGWGGALFYLVSRRLACTGRWHDQVPDVQDTAPLLQAGQACVLTEIMLWNLFDLTA